MKRALITGITGQDGSYLAELLLNKGYEVHGIVRRVAGPDAESRLWRIEHFQDRLKLHQATLESYASIHRAVKRVQPDELYHLAAQSFVATSFDDEFSTMAVNVGGTHHVLSAVRDLAPKCRVYFAGSSEMFGNAAECPQRESTAMSPRSPYGVSKVAGFGLTKVYREAYSLHASSGIMFNHESPRRGSEFVTRKIARGAARIKTGMDSEIRLGNLEASRDWGHAVDYVQAMWLMLQQDEPGDYVVATGESHTVREFAALAFECVGLDWLDHVVTDKALLRPAEVCELRGDASRAHTVLGWEPDYRFRDLVREMVLVEMARWLPDESI